MKNQTNTSQRAIIERLKAAESHYRESKQPFFADGLLHAIELAGDDGWKHIAPVWFDNIKNEGDNK